MKFNLCLLCLFVAFLIFIPMTLKPASPDSQPVQASSAQQWESPESPSLSAVPEPIPVPSIQPTETDENHRKKYKPPLWFKVPSKKVSLEFKILNESTGQVETIGYQDYVKGAICAEIPPDFHLEAMKAQGVAALTYAIYNQNLNRASNNPALSGADFSADPMNWKVYVTEDIARQRYGDQFDIYWSKISEAAEEAAKTVMVYEGEPILAAYHSTSSGITEGAENVWEHPLPYLVPVDSHGDLLAPQYEVKTILNLHQMKEALTASLPDLSLDNNPYDWLEVLERSEGGYVTSVRVGNQTIHGKELRSILNLRSSDFSISFNGESFTITCYGYGHGVGLSQYGADYMAMQGASAEEILQHYFTGITLMDIDDFMESL